MHFMYIERRSIGMSILLTFITCGLYEIYWQYKVYESLYHANEQPSRAGMDILLTFVTCGLYFWYMLYKCGQLESTAFERHGLPPKNDAVLYVVLGIFTAGIVPLFILQSNLNMLADHIERGKFQ